MTPFEPDHWHDPSVFSLSFASGGLSEPHEVLHRLKGSLICTGTVSHRQAQVYSALTRGEYSGTLRAHNKGAGQCSTSRASATSSHAHVSAQRDLDISQLAFRLRLAEGAHPVHDEAVGQDRVLEALQAVPCSANL